MVTFIQLQKFVNKRLKSVIPALLLHECFSGQGSVYHDQTLISDATCPRKGTLYYLSPLSVMNKHAYHLQFFTP